MLTTFARIGKILNGEIQPKNWIERLFATFADSATHGLPTYTLDDENKVLTVEKVEDGTQTVTIIQYQNVEYTGGGVGGILAEGTYDDSTLEEGDEVTVVINNQETILIYYAGARVLASTKSSAIDATVGFIDGTIIIEGQASGIVNIGCEISEPKYKAQAVWKEVSGGDNV